MKSTKPFIPIPIKSRPFATIFLPIVYYLFSITYCLLPTVASAQFTTLWTQTNNPGLGYDYAFAIKADANGLFVAGGDMFPGNEQWRIEKRNLSTGNVIWTQQNNPNTGNDRVYAITTFSGPIYAAGVEEIPGGGDNQWRIEKRAQLGGNLIGAFGTGGAVTSNPSPGEDNAYAITADASGIYVVGIDESIAWGNTQWRIEKRDMATGALIPSFGIGGVVTSNPSSDYDYAYAIVADASGIYIAGSDYSLGSTNPQWRIEKRDLTTGVLIPAFGAGGVVTNNVSATIDWANSIAVDASGIYVAGSDRSLGGVNSQWRVEKRNLTTGTVIWTQTSNVSASYDYAMAMTVDANGVYVTGIDNNSGSEWRTEKYDLSTGALLCSLRRNPSAGDDDAFAITADASGIYVAGTDQTFGNDQWRIEKYDLCGVVLPPSVTASGAIICVGDCATINANPSGGTSPYIYSWNSGGQTTSAVVVCPTITTTYTITIMDASSSTATTTVTVTVNPQPSIIISPASSTICFGQSATLSGSGAVSYNWSPVGQMTTSIAVSPTINSSYTVTGTDGNGCSNTAISPVTVDPLPFADTGPDISMCAGSSTTLNGSGNGSFSWAPSTALSNTTIANPVASPTSAITYTLTVTNNCGTATDVMTITTPATPSANAGNDVTICRGSSTTLLGSGAGSFVWANAATLSCSSCQNPIANPTSTTTYTLTITDICGSQSDLVNVTVNDPQVTISGTTTICSGSSSTLAASGTVSYSWLPLGQTSPVITVNPTLGANTYTVTGTDSNGCTNTTTTTVTVNPKPVINIGSPTTICNGSNATLTASGSTAYLWSTAETTATITVAPTTSATYTYSVIVSDGMCQDTASTTVTVVPKITAFITGNSTICNGQSTTLTASGGTSYAWSTGSATSNITVNPTTASNTYSVKVTSGSCIDSASVVVIVHNLPTASITANTTICSGSSTTFTAGGGTTYLWNTTATTSSITPTPAGTTSYTVMVTDANGCTTTATATATVNPNPNAAINGNTTICSGSTTTLTATGGGTYSWSTGQSTGSIIFTPTNNPSYTVIVTGTNGCTATATAAVTVLPKPTATISCSDTICEGNSATLTASGGTSYLWSNSSNTSSITVTPANTTNYSVIVSIGTCTATANCSVIVQPPPVVKISSNVTISEGQSTTLTATIASAVTYSYSWSPSTGLNNPNISNPTATPAITTQYCVTVTDALGCTSDSCVTVTVELIDCDNAGELYLPNAFSPNGDGENDVLQIYYGNLQCIQTLQLTVYDRWGEKVFITEDPYSTWDGSYNGNVQSTAVFVYYLDATLLSGKTITKKGNISLIQ